MPEKIRTKKELIEWLAEVDDDTPVVTYDSMKDCFRPVNFHVTTHRDKKYLSMYPAIGGEIEIR